MNAKDIETVDVATMIPDQSVRHAELLRTIAEGLQGTSGVVERLGRAVPQSQGSAAMRASGR
ncbi:MAG: hypothetical protein ABIK36_17850 [Pseudomonadota bacterium]